MEVHGDVLFGQDGVNVRTRKLSNPAQVIVLGKVWKIPVKNEWLLELGRTKVLKDKVGPRDIMTTCII